MVSSSGQCKEYCTLIIDDVSFMKLNDSHFPAYMFVCIYIHVFLMYMYGNGKYERLKYEMHPFRWWHKKYWEDKKNRCLLYRLYIYHVS